MGQGCWAYEHIVDHDFFSRRFVKFINALYHCKECHSVRFDFEDRDQFVWHCTYCGADFDTRKTYTFSEM